MNRILVTGAAGFIGFHLCQRLLSGGKAVVGVDSLNDYYSVGMKRDRLSQLSKYPAFEFLHLDLADRQACENLFAAGDFETVLHMAAQAGVRYSLENPYAYGESNLTAFLYILEGCRRSGVQHLVYASSSSVYGNSFPEPSTTEDTVNQPVSLYAATKKANELMAHSYSHLYGLPTTGLRFFTVYGPWGRPDMAVYKFVEAICQQLPIDVYNHGKMRRSFTYIDDVVDVVVRVAEKIPCGTSTPYQIFNVGNDQSIELEQMISLLEDALGKRAIRNYLEMQPGDVHSTCADISGLRAAVGYTPSTPIDVGLARFVEWYQQYTHGEPPNGSEALLASSPRSEKVVE